MPDGAEAAVVPRLWPGSTIVCLASGPSLTREDVEACRGRAHVIAVNDTHQLAPWADVLYSSDLRWWEYYQGVPGFAGRKYSIVPLKPASAWGVTVLRNTGHAGVEPDPSGLRTGRNSGAAAMNVAAHLGARRIVLLGYDMGIGEDGRRHFFGEHPQRIRNESPYESFIAMFRTMVKPLQQLGVEVLNCSRRTALDVFPIVSLQEALA